MGLLLLDKPRGVTSTHCVAKVRRTLMTLGAPKSLKVGHFGTLDPFADGLVLIATSSTTKLAQYVSGTIKRYRASLILGVATDTGDLDGVVIEAMSTDNLHADRIREVVEGFTGAFTYIPPRYSAKKIAGVPSYRLARRGEAVALHEVTSIIHAARFTGFDAGSRTILFEVEVGSGTYVRSIGEEIARRLGTVGHLVALTRLSIGSYDLRDAVALDALLADPGLVSSRIIPNERILADARRLELDDDSFTRFIHGDNFVVTAHLEPDDPGSVGIVAGEGTLVGFVQRIEGEFRIVRFGDQF